MLKQREIVQFLRDRIALLLLGAFLLCNLILIALTIFNTHVSDVQVPTRYSGYGFTNVYREQWYSLLAFVGFALIAGGVNSFIAIKFHSIRRAFSIGFLAASLAIGVMSVIIAVAIFNLAAFSV
jgi:uncharacterized membrane protein YidH (DUF202 family)